MRESLRRRGIDGFLVTGPVNVRYLSGFTGSSGFVLVTKEKNFFVTDFRYREQVQQAIRGGTMLLPVSDWELVIESGNRVSVIKKIVRTQRIALLAFEASLPYEAYECLVRARLRLKPLRGFLEQTRRVKHAEEIACIRHAVSRAEAAFLDVKPFIRAGKEERAIARMLEERLKKRGCERIPFDIIVASGRNGAMPHARSSAKRLSPEDLVVIDWGGEADGYFSDMTRTVLIRGRRLARQREIYRVVLAANQSAVAAARSGIPAGAIDKAARDSIKNAGYGEYFGHGTGHGVGLEVHESPRIRHGEKQIVPENTVFTIEPGIYLPGLGGVRIEDMVLAKPDGAEVLTALPGRLEVI